MEIPPELKMADAIDLFLRWGEEQGWHFGGGFREIIDGYYVTPDGTRTGRVE